VHDALRTMFQAMKSNSEDQILINANKSVNETKTFPSSNFYI